MATFQSFFLLGRAKDLSAPVYMVSRTHLAHWTAFTCTCALQIPSENYYQPLSKSNPNFRRHYIFSCVSHREMLEWRCVLFNNAVTS